MGQEICSSYYGLNFPLLIEKNHVILARMGFVSIGHKLVYWTVRFLPISLEDFLLVRIYSIMVCIYKAGLLYILCHNSGMGAGSPAGSVSIDFSITKAKL